MKNLLNAMTDLQRTQHMLLGTKTPYQIIRKGVRMQAFLGVFKRAAATASRRWAAGTQWAEQWPLACSAWHDCCCCVCTNDYNTVECIATEYSSNTLCTVCVACTNAMVL